MIDDVILRIADAFDDLHALVVSEPALAEFAVATAELCAIGDRARSGKPVELTVPPTATARIPTREMAERRERRFGLIEQIEATWADALRKKIQETLAVRSAVVKLEEGTEALLVGMAGLDRHSPRQVRPHTAQCFLLFAQVSCVIAGKPFEATEEVLGPQEEAAP